MYFACLGQDCFEMMDFNVPLIISHTPAFLAWCFACVTAFHATIAFANSTCFREMSLAAACAATLSRFQELGRNPSGAPCSFQQFFVGHLDKSILLLTCAYNKVAFVQIGRFACDFVI